MEASVTAFILSKLGNSADECEDAYDFSLTERRFALSDGATESTFSDRWAKGLVKQYIVDPPFGMPPDEDAMQIWLVPQQDAWTRSINWATLPWFAEEKAKKGAFATFLGVEFAREEVAVQEILGGDTVNRLPWQAFAVGDTCLFQVRENNLVASFPLDKSELFNSRPILLASNVINNVSAVKSIQAMSGYCQEGDRFFMATDALAKWILARHEAGDAPWSTLLTLRSQEDFNGFVDTHRKNQSMRNDDTTLVIVEWVAKPASPKPPAT